MTVPFNNIPADVNVPLFYGEMDNSMANSGVSTLRRLLIAQVNDDQVLLVNQMQPMARVSDAVALGGAGSMLASMYAAWRKSDPAGEVWVLPVKVTTGTAAGGKVTFEGVATEGGLLNLYVGATRVRATVVIGQTAAESAAAMASAINAASLPLVAQAAAGVVTLTCRWKGDTGNDIRLAMNFKGASANEKTPAGVSVTLTNLTGGTGSPDLVSLLALVGDEPFEFICHPYSDSASLDDFKEWMNDSSGRWSYAQQLWGHVYTGRRGTMGQLSAFGKERNDAHMTIEGFEPTKPDLIWDDVAAYTARQAAFISADPARPTQTGELVGSTPAPSGERFVFLERSALLKNGIATQKYAGSSVQIERARTTYQRNSYGQPDDSYYDSETMHVSGAVMRRLQSIITSKYGRHKLASDGTKYGPGDAIVTPSVIRNELIGEYQLMETAGLVENSALFAKYLIVERDARNPNRLNVLFPPDYVNQLRIFALLNQFRLQYAETA
ncbi:phage tail sheath subtilisin-like domain-containing protein [Herbaspirillum rubrisubalbicans]|uniref:phage tail sheath subtilisin-like domain-containing protein n=1 Tax=Herbaspirillum rubrisubalbicans TaxID=80842 RepID=UPI00030F5CB0|nr:phage tail sheath subtilisin-like domain-containing protein [Herbaspirillum rubrisubalbicans]